MYVNPITEVKFEVLLTLAGCKILKSCSFCLGQELGTKSFYGIIPQSSCCLAPCCLG